MPQNPDRRGGRVARAPLNLTQRSPLGLNFISPTNTKRNGTRTRSRNCTLIYRPRYPDTRCGTKECAYREKRKDEGRFFGGIRADLRLSGVELDKVKFTAFQDLL
ncbi:hypothetical protein EVAR_16026_1 [Eumeta japonica]|uniref:Uncharacterized protein n=1 Tax=Eumeta variegata TaxID=151549 RepID=A0A4C1VYQ3_EUMVA|nr:hypothetical protein EVAR_16026_1 [Eumeta japonica]